MGFFFNPRRVDVQNNDSLLSISSVIRGTSASLISLGPLGRGAGGGENTSGFARDRSNIHLFICLLVLLVIHNDSYISDIARHLGYKDKYENKIVKKKDK